MKTCILALQRYERLGDIDEWIKYHLNIKFDKIFILDNNDEDTPLIYDDPCVEIIPYYGQRNDGTDWKWQREAYNYGFEYIRSNYPNEYDWISIIDIDEFIKLLTCSDIKEFIQKELIDKNHDSLALKWELYDDNNSVLIGHYRVQYARGNDESDRKQPSPALLPCRKHIRECRT